VVQVEYDPAQVSYDELLSVFWANHDPTTPDRQGWDVGRQYRSAVFYHTPEQKTAAEGAKGRLDNAGAFKRKIVTEVTPAAAFWRAEEYHQDYYQKCGLKMH
jgi:peptide-methionine (S)-S-oxide reductase